MSCVFYLIHFPVKYPDYWVYFYLVMQFHLLQGAKDRSNDLIVIKWITSIEWMTMIRKCDH